MTRNDLSSGLKVLSPEPPERSFIIAEIENVLSCTAFGMRESTVSFLLDIMHTTNLDFEPFKCTLEVQMTAETLYTMDWKEGRGKWD